MRTALLAAVCLTLPLGTAYAADAIETVEGGAPSANAITIDKMAFGTPEIKIKVGDTVTWTNKDAMAHNVHFRQGPAKGAPNAQGKMLATDATWTVKFNTAGDYSYICTPHPMMKGKVIVE